MKCYECNGPCRKQDVKKVGDRIGSGKKVKGKRKNHYVCDFCREVEVGYEAAFIANVLREEIRKKK